MLICDNMKCSGCGLCESICPKNAVSLQLNEEGFLFPVVSKDCISCNKCIKFCPQNRDTNTYVANKFFKAYSLDDTLRNNSTSGGVVGEIYRYAASLGYYLFGVVFEEDFSCKFIETQKFSEVKYFHGSKYIGAKTNKCYRLVENILREGGGVCFIGTPCECAALRNYLHCDYDKLIVVDFICHGVASEKALKKYIKETELKHGKISEFKMRSKEGGYLKFNEKFTFLNGTCYVDSFYKSDFGFLFASGISLRQGCYSCKYVGLNRVSDITVGDWAYNIGKENGVSLLIENSKTGKKIIEELLIKEQINAQPIAKETAVANAHRLTHISIVPKYRKDFFKNIDKTTLKFLAKKYHRAYSLQIKTILHKLKSKLLNMLKRSKAGK